MPDIDLISQRAVRYFFEKERPEYCFLPSIKEGGIEANITYPADLIYHNLVMQANIIHSAYDVKVKKLVFFASSCVYPKKCRQPIKEEYLLNGRPEDTNEPYAVAKISGIKMCQAYNKQHKTNFITVIPATIYGPNDNFDCKTSHVIPSLIRRFHQAKISGKSEVTIWGTGRPKREFVYIDDITEASLFLMKINSCQEIINIGNGADISIFGLAGLIRETVGFNGRIVFDKSKPDGVFRKLLDTSKINNLGWKAKINLYNGLQKTYNWYIDFLEHKQ